MAMDREYLEEQQREDYKLLKALEKERRFASDPKQRAKLEQEIQALQEQIRRREAELDSSAPQEPLQIDAAALKTYAARYQSRYGLLKLLGMPQAVQLEDIYTKVRFLDDLSIRRFQSIEAMEETYRQGQHRQFQRGRPRRAEDGIAVANAHQYLMVLGGPGAGKSTFLRRLGLEALKGESGQFQHPCLPVMLELKQFAGEVNLVQAIARAFADFGLSPSEAFATQALEQGKLLVLLDGLDEVPRERFNVVVDAIQAFAVRYDQNRFVASCRIAAYRSGFQRFRDIELADFEDDQIQQFIHNWFSSELDRQSGIAEKCWQLLNQASHEAAKELAQTPLLLTFICLVYDRSQELPQQRSTLYKNALDILLKEWAAEKRVTQDAIYQGLNTELEKVLLSEIAYQGFAHDRLFFQPQELVDQIQTFLSDTVDNPKYLDGKAVLDAIAVQQGILVERAEDVFSFSHLTLQEYLTALYASQDSEQIAALVSDHLTEQRWREVFLLVAGIVRSADRLLLQMEKTAQHLISTPTLQVLLSWTDQVTTVSEGGYSLVGKRAAVIYFALRLARISVVSNFSCYAGAKALHVLDRDLANTLAVDLPHDLVHALADAVDAAVDNNAMAFRSALANARTFEGLKILKDGILSMLIDGLEVLQAGIPDYEQPKKLWRSWMMDVFQLKREWLDLSEDEDNALANYLYACDLMVRCKEAAVRVSRTTWVQIEGRMLRPDQFGF